MLMHFYKFGNRAKKHRISIALIHETLSAIISKPLRHIASICQAVSTSQQLNYTATKCIFEFSVSRLKTGRKQTRKFSFSFFFYRRENFRDSVENFFHVDQRSRARINSPPWHIARRTFGRSSSRYRT